MNSVLIVFIPQDVLEYNFFDKRIEETYANEKNIGRLSLILSVIAIIIECLGLLGLIAYMVVKRNKEVGIRKILGSSIYSITMIFMKSFVAWVIIAWPVAWVLAKRWLENFAYSIRLDLTYFIFAGLISLIIALLTISVQVYRAARRNPVDSIKYE